MAATDPAHDDRALPETAAPSSVSGVPSAAQPVARAAGPRRAVLLLLIVVAIAVLAIDQAAKAWVIATLPRAVPQHIIGDLLIFRRVENSGAAFSLASGSTWVFSIIAAAVVVFLVWFARRIRSVGWAVLFGLLLGGTLGNLTDRLIRAPGFGVGEVVDFIQIPLLPAIFNIADSAIVSSMVLFILLTLRGVGLDGVRRTATHQSAA